MRRSVVAFLCIATTSCNASLAMASADTFWPGPPENATCTEALFNQSVCEDDTGVSVFFRGEFGTEFLMALPVAFAAFKQGRLAETRGCGAVSDLYYFSAKQCVARCCYGQSTHTSVSTAAPTSCGARALLFDAPDAILSLAAWMIRHASAAGTQKSSLRFTGSFIKRLILLVSIGFHPHYGRITASSLLWRCRMESF